MNLNHRQNQILEQINSHGQVKIGELREQFGVTDMTIRRDLEKMEKLGLLHRTYGGAISASKDIALHERTEVMKSEKRQTGKRAAELVQSGEALYIDAGTTTLQVARHLSPQLDITVVTNALHIALELQEKGIPTIVTGGILRESTSSLVGPLAQESISKMAFDQIFLGATGITARNGCSNSNVFEAEVKQWAIKQAKEVNVVVDHSKFDVQSLSIFADWDHIHRLITDQAPPDDLVHVCQQHNVEVVIP